MLLRRYCLYLGVSEFPSREAQRPVDVLRHCDLNDPSISSRTAVESKAVVTTAIRLRLDCDSIAIQLPFHCILTAPLRPLHDLLYDCRPTDVWAAALRPN